MPNGSGGAADDTAHYKQPVMRLHTRIDPHGAMTFVVIGCFDATCIADFERTLAAARRLEKEIHVDLSQLTVVDCASLHYLFDLPASGVIFIGQTPHVWRWLIENALRSPNPQY